MKLGVVGVGTMGSRMASALTDAGYQVFVYDVAESQARTVAEQASAEVSSSPADLAAQVTIALLSLPGPDEVRDVVSGERGLLASGPAPELIIDLSTVDPISTRKRAAEASDAGVAYVDAPVLGRPSKVGHWTLPVGGEERHIETGRPVLENLAARIVHVGEVGSGNVLKLLNNLMFGAINGITVEAMTIAKRMGVDLQVFYDTIAESNAASVSNLFLEIGPKIIEGDMSPDFSVDLLQKDNTLAIEMARAVSVPTVVANAVTVLNSFGQDRGLGELDTSALTEVFDTHADD